MEGDQAVHPFCNQSPGIWHPSQVRVPINFIVTALRYTHTEWARIYHAPKQTKTKQRNILV